MNYQVLARKWRPKNFSDIVGQEHIIKILMHSFLLNKIHHAYVLSGTRGIGKTTIARLIAKGLNCKNKIQFDMCNKCSNCKEIMLGHFSDLIEIDAATRTKIEDVRDFLNNVQYMPSKGRFKIYLIDEVHMLSRYSFNALLKILEEPPEHIKFILITTEYQKLPLTILSRCLQLHFKPLTDAEIVKKLKYILDQEHVISDIYALETLAHAAKGSMRDALNLTEQAIVLGKNKINKNIIDEMFGVIRTQHPLQLIENLINGNVNEIMSQIDDYSRLEINWDYLISEILISLQKIIIVQSYPNFLKKENNNIIDCSNKKIIILSQNITSDQAQSYYQIFLLGRKELPYLPNYRMGLEMMVLKALTINSKDINKTNNYTKNQNSTTLLISQKTSNIYEKQRYSKQDINNIKSMETYEKNQKNNDDIQRNISDVFNQEISSETASTILKARSQLLKYKISNKFDKIQKNVKTMQSNPHTVENILKRFTKINTNISDREINMVKKNEKKFLFSNNLKIFHKNYDKIKSSVMKETFQEAIQDHPWISQINKLSLSKKIKRLIMYAWKEDVSQSKICLHFRSNIYHRLDVPQNFDAIQKSLSELIGIPIILDLKKDDNFLVKTPIEYIKEIYENRILQIKKDFLHNPSLQTLKKFFDIEYDENQIHIL